MTFKRGRDRSPKKARLEGRVGCEGEKGEGTTNISEERNDRLANTERGKDRPE